MSVPEESAGVDTRTRLLCAAQEMFIAEGYRASVDAIAARAGVAKQTLYNHFPRKEDLFIEVIDQGTAAVVVALDSGPGDLRESLLRFARTFQQRALGRDGVAMLRILAAEIYRLPELTQAFFEKGPGQTRAALAEFLSGAMDQGRLRRDDPGFAAEMLMGMLLNMNIVRLLCETLLPDDLAGKRCEQIVDCFLRAFAPQC